MGLVPITPKTQFPPVDGDARNSNDISVVYASAVTRSLELLSFSFNKLIDRYGDPTLGSECVSADTKDCSKGFSNRTPLFLYYCRRVFGAWPASILVWLLTTWVCTVVQLAAVGHDPHKIVKMIKNLIRKNRTVRVKDGKALQTNTGEEKFADEKMNTSGADERCTDQVGIYFAAAMMEYVVWLVKDRGWGLWRS